MPDLGTFSMPLEVYFQTGMVRGVLVTNQDRLSNFLILRDPDEVFTLADATFGLGGRERELKTDECIVYMQQIAVIADLSPKLGSQPHLYVKKDATRALISVGPYWLRGNVHLVPGTSIHDVLMANTRFIPVTDAAFVDRTDLPPRTFLANRNHISCIAALRD